MANSITLSQMVDEYISKCPVIPETANYWFVRTEGGSLYDAFVTSSSIAYGLEDISLKTVQALPFTDENRKILSRQIANTYPSIKIPGLAAAQLFTFVHKMKAGDFVVIPSYGSRKLAVGILVNKPAFESDLLLNDVKVPGYNKRRSVKWLKEVDRSTVNPNLLRILLSRVAITDITICDQWIDTLVYDFFRKGKDYHFALAVEKRSNINARDLFDACSGLFHLSDDLAAEWHVEGNSNAIETRINLNSPGVVELIAGMPYVLVLGMMVIALVGGKFSTKDKGINLQSDGFMQKLNTFLNDRKKRQLSDTVRDKLEALQVKDSDDIINIIEKINKL